MSNDRIYFKDKNGKTDSFTKDDLRKVMDQEVVYFKGYDGKIKTYTKEEVRRILEEVRNLPGKRPIFKSEFERMAYAIYEWMNYREVSGEEIEYLTYMWRHKNSDYMRLKAMCNKDFGENPRYLELKKLVKWG